MSSNIMHVSQTTGARCGQQCRRAQAVNIRLIPQLSQSSQACHRARCPALSSTRSLACHSQLPQRRQSCRPCRRGPAPVAAATATQAPPAAGTAREQLSFERYDGPGIAVEVSLADACYQVSIVAERQRPMVLHWAVNDWQLPPSEAWPPGTVQIDEKAVQTPFEGNARVLLSFPEGSCPKRVVFVLKETQPEAWISNGGDFSAYLKPPGVDEVVDRVLNIEGSDGHWSLVSRLMLANEVLDAADAAGPVGMAFIATWLRLSSNKQLTWYRKSARQGKDIAHSQKVLAQRMADKGRGAKDPTCRRLARLALAGLPRGGGDGDAIRLGILNIMREHGIREGHRPGIECKFIEQWHQKLHQNTNPEDIAICQAYIAFLESGNMDDFWRVAWDNGRVTRETLAAMDQPITADPLHLPQLTGAMKHYLWTLKITHGGADLDGTLEMAKGALDPDLQWNMYDLLANRSAWWAPGKIVELRRRLEPIWRGSGSRDVALLDIALDNWFRTLLERQDRSSLDGDALVELIGLALDNAVLAGESQELAQCATHWHRVKDGKRWSRDWGQLALAAADRVELALGEHMDTLYRLMQPHAEAFQRACGIDEAYIRNFGEEVVRGQPAFVLSMLLRWLAPALRETAGVSSWQVVSTAEASGRMSVLPSLADVQGQDFDTPHILIAERVGGMEDIPMGVTAVLTASPTDVLSHVAIRARSQGVLLATCFDEAQLEALKALDGKDVALTVSATQQVTATEQAAGASANGSGPAAGGSQPKLNIPPPAATQLWALAESEFAPGLVGGKSRNLATLRAKLPGSIAVPSSVALPFGTFERTLREKANAGAAKAIAALQKQLGQHRGPGVPDALQQLRSAVGSSLQPPPALAAELASKASAAGLPGAAGWADAGSGEFAAVWSAICQVWASKWNNRAWLSRRARGVPDDALFMAALIQQVVPAQYAFVVHTADPLTGDQNGAVGELVVGMGEALVGNLPGRALSFTAAAGNGAGGVEVTGLPSKRLGLFAAPQGGLIVRSDSNGEDLESFAGAGLYDSIPLPPLREAPVDYAGERLLWDPDFRQELLGGIAAAAAQVEAAFDGQPQDIEGVWVDGQLTVVQSRPQVL